MEQTNEQNSASPGPKKTGIKTYVDDLTKAVQGGKEGIIRKITLEDEQHREEKEALSPRSKRNKAYLIASIVVIVLTIFLVHTFASVRQKESVVPVAPQFIPLVSTDGSKVEDAGGLSAGGIASLVVSDINANSVKPGGIEGIYLTENQLPIGLRKFADLAGLHLVAGDPALVSDTFFLGAYHPDAAAGNSPPGEFLMVIKGSSFLDLYPAIHGWEKYMFADLRSFIGMGDYSYNYLAEKDFADSLFENKNARVLYDNNGNVALMYVYADDNSVVVTDGEDAASEAILRLSAGQVKK
ncbi:MAG TPA: hypothetical protein VG694_01040 [Candidatus Paceibacterota bacterium]|jgi:hypothetical protein|nr:hypothetical protein [Candidatus Paceibacterota bacterium]